MRPQRYVLMMTAPILATSVLLVAIGGAAAWYVHQLNQEVSYLLAHNLECTIASQKLVLGIRDAHTEMLHFINGGDGGNLQAVLTIELPPLRDRLEDLPALLRHFITLYDRELGKQIQSAAAGVVEMLSEYSWPGNVRELQSAVKFALIHARGNVLTPECFPENCRVTAGQVSSQAVSGPRRESNERNTHVTADAGCPTESRGPDIAQRFEELLNQRHADVYHTIGNEVDRYLLTKALGLAHGNQVEASRLLGISRTTLRAKLESLGLSIEKHVQTNAGQDDQNLNT